MSNIFWRMPQSVVVSKFLGTAFLQNVTVSTLEELVVCEGNDDYCNTFEMCRKKGGCPYIIVKQTAVQSR